MKFLLCATLLLNSAKLQLIDSVENDIKDTSNESPDIQA